MPSNKDFISSSVKLDFRGLFVVLVFTASIKRQG